jgi:hypothetical protein
MEDIYQEPSAASIGVAQKALTFTQTLGEAVATLQLSKTKSSRPTMTVSFLSLPLATAAETTIEDRNIRDRTKWPTSSTWQQPHLPTVWRHFRCTVPTRCTLAHQGRAFCRRSLIMATPRTTAQAWPARTFQAPRHCCCRRARSKTVAPVL